MNQVDVSYETKYYEYLILNSKKKAIILTARAHPGEV